jgi:hypothetical protein
VSKNETENSRAKEAKAENFSAAVAALKRGEVIVFPPKRSAAWAPMS